MMRWNSLLAQSLSAQSLPAHTSSLKQLEILSEEIAEYQNELENMDTLNKVNPGDITTGESFTEVYNDKGESVSGERNEHSDGNLSNDNNLSSQSSDSDSDDTEEIFYSCS